ncbi:MAG: SDR family oxidoreductase [Chloroflexi bacterium]|nr:SDR family oxidoreductase [Chloroflexota bacterium]
MYREKSSLQGRVAIVTGSAGGIGLAIADCFAEHGADVLLVDIKSDELKDAAKQVAKHGHKALAFPGNAREQGVVDLVTRAAVDTFGRVDIMVNNAGGTIRKLFMDMTDQEWMDAIDLNLVQAMRWTRSTAKVMQAKEIKGSIINVTTIEAFRAAPGYAPYAAAKAGLTNLTKTLSLELGTWGIRVNAIAPDVTVSPGILKMRPDWHNAPKPVHVALGRRGQPEDHAGAALYLASDLSSWVTGETIHVGGGTMAASGWRLTSSGHWSTDGIGPQVFSGKPYEP